jgi:RNA polymerase sigma-70 factor (ECF subfamily)
MQEQVLTQFLIENQAYLYRMAYSYLKHPEDAMDAVQSTACRALEQSHTLRNPSAVRPWVTRILLNICKNTLRQQKKLVYLPDEQLDLGGYTMPDFDDSLTRQVEALPFDQRAIVQLRFYNELTLQEISEVTGYPLSTVKTKLYTALKRLKVNMKGDETDE